MVHGTTQLNKKNKDPKRHISAENSIFFYVIIEMGRSVGSERSKY